MSLYLAGNSLFTPHTEIKNRIPVGEAELMYPAPEPDDGNPGMQSLTKLFRVGMGPSSSHTMGPRRAAERFLRKNSDCKSFRVELYGSLAATGKGHQTDTAVLGVLDVDGRKCELIWKEEECLPLHPNGMRFLALDDKGGVTDKYECYSVGGGAIVDNEGDIDAVPGSASAAKWKKYPLYTMNQLLEWCDKTGRPLHDYVYENEDADIKDVLWGRWEVMEAAIQRGIHKTGVLPGGLSVPRKGPTMYRKAINSSAPGRTSRSLIFAYALAVMEENSDAGIIVTAPTCGSCGVVPATIGYLKEALPNVTKDDIINAMATAGLVGNVIKTNASISGAEVFMKEIGTFAVGCQGEVGSASSMAAAAAAFLMGGSPRQIEYAAEMAMEHFLGLTCDPVEGLVQIPCIERNAFGATRALDAAEFAMMTDGQHRISFDEVVLTMKLTGIDIEECYRETSRGGLASTWNLDETLAEMGEMKDIVAELVEQKRLANMARSISRTLSSASNSSADVREIARSLSQMSNSSSRRGSYVDKCKNAKLPVHC